MVARPYGYALFVEQLSCFGRGNARQLERDDAHAVAWIAYQGEAVDLGEALSGVFGELVLVVGDSGDADTSYVV